MVYSSTILLFCILSLRIYDKQTQVPILIQRITGCLRFRCILRRTKPAKIEPDVKHARNEEISYMDDVMSVMMLKRKDSKPEEVLLEIDNKDVRRMPNKVNDVTWTTVGKTFDIYCFLSFYFVFASITSSIFVNIYNNNG